MSAWLVYESRQLTSVLDTIYLATEPPFNAQRLFGILQKNMGPLAHLRDGENDLSGPGSRVLGLIVDNLDTQTHILRYQLPNLLGSGRPYSRVKLLILDSVTANFRGEYTASDKKGMADRGAELFDLGAELKSLADRFGLCVVVTNQVTGAMQPTNSSDGPWAEESSKPSLGLAWSNVVNTRLRLGKRRLPYAANLDPELPATGQSIMRHISVDFAPNLSKGSGCLFEIYEGGIRGCPNQ